MLVLLSIEELKERTQKKKSARCEMKIIILPKIPERERDVQRDSVTDKASTERS
jgi:hypothetical protein